MSRKQKIVLGIVSILLALFTWFYQTVIYDVPSVTATQISENDVVKVNGSYYVLNNSWIRLNAHGNWECYIEGNGYERGVTLGLLQKELGKQQEAVFVAEIDNHVNSWFLKKFLLVGIAWFNRELDQQIPKEYREEIYGISQFFSDDFDNIGPKYNRVINYHAAHDIGHAVQNMHLVGCTALGTWSFDSAAQYMYMGRNFDFYFGDDFAKNKVVLLSKPDSGYAYVSVTWPSFVGVVSGMNEKGLGITLNSDKSEIPTGSGTPVSIIARDILQYASNIEEAVAISNRYTSFVSESFTISSAYDQTAVVIEKTPEKTDVYRVSGDTIVVTNHFQSNGLKDLPINVEFKKKSESVRRYNRTAELVTALDTVNPIEIAQILRDQKGVNNEDIGMGNPLALNQLLAHHAVIFENVHQTIWVSAYPFQLNVMGAYSLKDFDDWNASSVAFPITIDSLEIPIDPFYSSSDYELFTEHKKLGVLISSAIAEKEKVDAAIISEYIHCNSEFYGAYKLVGDYYYALKNTKKAIKNYEIALTKEVAYQEDVVFIEARIKELKAND